MFVSKKEDAANFYGCTLQDSLKSSILPDEKNAVHSIGYHHIVGMYDWKKYAGSKRGNSPATTTILGNFTKVVWQ